MLFGVFCPVIDLVSISNAVLEVQINRAPSSVILLSPELKEAYCHLTSRVGGHFWTSGQWMTERGGGSAQFSPCTVETFLWKFKSRFTFISTFWTDFRISFRTGSRKFLGRKSE